MSSNKIFKNSRIIKNNFNFIDDKINPQNTISNINIFKKSYSDNFNLFNPNINLFPSSNRSFSFENLSDRNPNRSNYNNFNKSGILQNNQSKYFQLPDSNKKYVLNTNLDMQKIFNYNINNINSDITNGTEFKIPIKEIKKNFKTKKYNLKRSNSNKSSSVENSEFINDSEDLNYNLNAEKLKTKDINSKKKVKDKRFINNSNNNSNSEFSINGINSLKNTTNSHSEKNFNSDLTLEEENSSNKSIVDILNKNKNRKISENINSRFDETDEETKKNLQDLRKAYDGLLFYRINLSGSSNTKILLQNINQIQKIL